MAWLAGWSYRVPITANASALAGTGTKDVTCVMSATLSHFWANIDAPGAEIRVTKHDGTTALTYEWEAASFSKVNMTGTLEIDNAPYYQAPSVIVAWLYYGNAGAADGHGAVVPDTPISGYIEELQAYHPILLSEKNPGQTTPRDSVAVTTTETRPVSVSLAAMLRPVSQAVGGKMLGEEIADITAEVLNSAGAAVNGAVVVANIRVNAGRRMLGQSFTVYVVGSTLADATDYTLSVTVYTSTGRIINARIGVLCRNVKP